MAHLMDRSHWAKKSRQRTLPPSKGGPTPQPAPGQPTENDHRLSLKQENASDIIDLSGPSPSQPRQSNALTLSSQQPLGADAMQIIPASKLSPQQPAASSAVVCRDRPASGTKGSEFIVPRPGVNGAVAGSLAGKTFVLTGLFPELGGAACVCTACTPLGANDGMTCLIFLKLGLVGIVSDILIPTYLNLSVSGGAGLDLGKARCRAMIEAFGGRVTGALSGKTSYLVVGKEPGQSKVGGR